MNLDEITRQKLSEAFRDYDEVIDKLESRLYDILDSYSIDIDYDEQTLINFEITDELREDMFEDDIEEFLDLQKQLKDNVEKRQQEYNSEIEHLPQETNKTEFKGFDITKTDPPFDEYFIKGNKDRDYMLKKYHYNDAYIAEITPEEYLILCGKYGWNKTFNNIDEIKSRLSQGDLDTIKEYAERFKAGERAPMLSLDVKQQGQEGRHRALACIEAGIDTVPVLIKI